MAFSTNLLGRRVIFTEEVKTHIYTEMRKRAENGVEAEIVGVENAEIGVTFLVQWEDTGTFEKLSSFLFRAPPSRKDSWRDETELKRIKALEDK